MCFQLQLILKGVLKRLGQTSGLRSPYHNKVKPSYLKHLLFEAESNKVLTSLLLHFYLRGTTTSLSAFSSNSKLRDASTRHCRCHSHRSQPPRDLSNGARDHDQTCLRVQRFRWRKLGRFALKCDATHNKNSAVINLGMRTASALVKY